MRSPMVENLNRITDKSSYSELQVLQSGAGYYIGTMFCHVEPNGVRWEEPGTRDSDYFRTRDDAEHYLKTLDIVGDTAAAMVLRERP